MLRPTDRPPGGAASRPAEAYPLRVDRPDLARHWDHAYRRRGSQAVSWYQPTPTISLELIGSLGVVRSDPLVDVGGGASTLVDALVVDGFEDVTVLDVSGVALDEARRRVGDAPGVHWVLGDVAAWLPELRYRLWHDRAVFHFLVEDDDRAGYLATLRAGLAPGGALILATFAPDGPPTCSGLPVARYSVDELAGVIGTGFVVEATRTESHTTPDGTDQPFTWVAARNTGGGCP
jgi:SAM-dependent methyltransferase